MENYFIKNYGAGFSLRKIPSSKSEAAAETITDKDIDKIKILEISYYADKWEQEILFSNNGFYSLKGIEASEKLQEYLEELNKFITSEINSVKFTSAGSRAAAAEIKQAKIKAVRAQMELYVLKELNNLQSETYEKALASCITRAVLYKSSPEAIASAYKNGLQILDAVSEKEEWNKKLCGYKKKQFLSDFHTAVINALIKAEDIAAYQYFNKYKDLFAEKDREKLEKKVNSLRVNITAYNWAAEVFSYRLDAAAYEKELAQIEDEDIKKAAGGYYRARMQSEKRRKALEEKVSNTSEWQEIIAAAEKDIEKAPLYIDYSSKPESIKRKNEYIRQIREAGAVQTDAAEFIKLAALVFKNFQVFKELDIQDYRGCLSKYDFEIFEKIQGFSEADFKKLEFDYKYAQKLLEKSAVKTDEDKYNACVMYFISISEYKEINKKEPDLEARMKIINMLLPEERKNEHNNNQEKEVKNK